MSFGENGKGKADGAMGVGFYFPGKEMDDLVGRFGIGVDRLPCFYLATG
jgi:hypothetical protein